MLAALVLAACGGEATAPAGGDQEALIQEGTPLEHIHGLGNDPADGRL